MNVRIDPSWQKVLQSQFDQPYFQHLATYVKGEYKTHTVYPPGQFIFNAFNSCPFDQVKVVILGQDPYHGAGQANGLSFSVADGVPIPPSLQNIYKELKDDLAVPIPKSGNLEKWARQGVLLLNATLTVRQNQAASHQSKGWEEFTDAVIKVLNEKKNHLVFILWGAYAQKKGAHIDPARHLIIQSPHPSPLSAHNGFFGSRPFSQANTYLIFTAQDPIDW